MFDLQEVKLILGAAVGVIAVVALMVVRQRLRRRAATQPQRELDLRIDLAALGDSGPPSCDVGLEFYNVPVRLAVLVVAPLGRDRRMPGNDELPAIVDGILPHMMVVLEDHQPVFRRWPPQLSWQGFAQAFFKNVTLPGNRGKGTRWCAVAGRFESGGRQWLAGLACCAAEANSLGQVSLQHEGQWLDVLRIRGDT